MPGTTSGGRSGSAWTRASAAGSGRRPTRYQTSVSPFPLTGIVPLGPDLSGWLDSHGREALGGRPFGEGTPPGPPPADEVVLADHTPLAA